ncbi:recombinase family protein, partial [Sphingopyxis flava]
HGHAQPPFRSSRLIGAERQPTSDCRQSLQQSRLGRSLAELLAIVEALRGQGIALLSLEEKIDTSSAAGELIFHVFGAIAHFERRLISERTRDGIAAARAKGKQPGRQPLDMSKVDAAIKLVEARISPTEAARQLGIGRSTIYREMRRLGVERPV